MTKPHPSMKISNDADDKYLIMARGGIMVDLGSGKRILPEREEVQQSETIPSIRQNYSFSLRNFVGSLVPFQRTDSTASTLAPPPPSLRQSSMPGAYSVFPNRVGSSSRQPSSARGAPCHDGFISDTPASQASSRSVEIPRSDSISEQSLVCATLIEAGGTNNRTATHDDSLGISSCTMLAVEASPAEDEFWILMKNTKIQCFMLCTLLVFCGLIGALSSSIKNGKSTRLGNPPQSLPATSIENATTAGPVEGPTLTPGTSPMQIYTNAPTRSPVTIPTRHPNETLANMDRQDLILETLVSVLPFDSVEALDDGDSPQAAAFMWLMEDELLYQFFNQRRISAELEQQDSISFRIIQRYALATLYFATGGTKWNDSNGWLSAEHECDWSRSLSTYDALYPGQDVCEEDRLISLNLSQNGLTGSLPKDIALLEHLETIELSINQISGRLPSQLSNLSSLKILNLSNNNFVGSLPSEWSNLSGLEILRLENNPSLLGIVPSSYGNLGSLVHFWLYETNIRGSIPEQVCLLEREGVLNPPRIQCLQVICRCCICTDDTTSSHLPVTSSPTTATEPDEEEDEYEYDNEYGDRR